jgi:glucokinase
LTYYARVVAATPVVTMLASPDALRHVLTIFLKEHSGQTKIHHALLAIAGPVKGERVALTNSSWVIDISELQTDFGLQVRIVNDFESVALSLPVLTSTDLARKYGMSRPNQIRTLPRVVSGVALPYNSPQPRPPRTGLAACGGEEQDHAAE